MLKVGSVAFGSKSRTDEGQAIIQTIDLGYLAVGSSESFGEDNDFDVYVVKTDVDGTTVWSEIYDPAFREQAFDVIETSDAGFIIVGSIEEEPGMERDVYLLKINASGKFLWDQKIDGGKDEVGMSITEGHGGGFMIGGKSRDEATGVSEFLLVKVNDEGETEWVKTYGTNEGKDDEVNAITKTANGYVLVGATERIDGTFDNEVAVRGLIKMEMKFGIRI